MGGKPSKEEDENGQPPRAKREEEDVWFNTLSKQEGDAKYNTTTRAVYNKRKLREIFKDPKLQSAKIVLILGGPGIPSELICPQVCKLFKAHYIIVSENAKQEDISRFVVSEMTKNISKSAFLVDGVFTLNSITDFEKEMTECKFVIQLTETEENRDVFAC